MASSVSTALHFSPTHSFLPSVAVVALIAVSFHCIVLCNALPTHCLATHCLRVRHCSHHNHCPAGELIPLLVGHSLQYLEDTFHFSRFQGISNPFKQQSLYQLITSLQISNTSPQFRRPKQQRSSGKRYYTPAIHPRASSK